MVFVNRILVILIHFFVLLVQFGEVFFRLRFFLGQFGHVAFQFSPFPGQGIILFIEGSNFLAADVQFAF